MKSTLIPESPSTCLSSQDTYLTNISGAKHVAFVTRVTETERKTASGSDLLLRLSGTGRTKVPDVDLLSGSAYFIPRKISGE